MLSRDKYQSKDVLFYRPIADASDYPTHHVPMLAPLSLSSCIHVKDTSAATAFNEGIFFHQGRYALAYALEEAGISKDTIVLMPAYHCRSLVEPAIFLGSNIIFYHLDKDLHPDMQDLKNKVSTADKPVKAMVLPHYFGFPQDMNVITEFCHSEDICLVEDCAHAYYSMLEEGMLGTYGKFSVASPRKFFPVEDGGILIDNSAIKNNISRLVRKPVLSEIKYAVKLANNLVKGLRISTRSKLTTESKLFDSNPITSVSKNATYESGLKWFNPDKSNLAGSVISRWLMNASPHSRNISIRIKNYKLWVTGIEGLQGCHALYPTLKEGVVPYVFPLVMDRNVETAFHAMKTAGIPIWRWEDLAVTNCAISHKYRHSLIQLPCHQGLSDEQMDWLVESVKFIINEINI